MPTDNTNRVAGDGADIDSSKGNQGFLIAGIGESAGGIQALRSFFAQVPADSGIAYVVILHLSPDHKSELADVLQHVATIPVSQVSGRVKIEPDHVYVLPPARHLVMEDGHIAALDNTVSADRRAPVDLFFRSLAESHHDNAACVVLSGTGADGTMGLKRIKERGGVVFVQNPREAEYNDMPRAAIATGLVDTVMNVGEIPMRIMAYRDARKNNPISIAAIEPEVQGSDISRHEEALRDVLTKLRKNTGHDFSNYKRATILRRIERRINVRGLADLPAYATYMQKQPDEARALLKDLLISVTNFFRDKEIFAELERDVIPRILQSKIPGEQIRIWVAGCATGEEAYSIANAAGRAQRQRHRPT